MDILFKLFRTTPYLHREFLIMVKNFFSISLLLLIFFCSQLSWADSRKKNDINVAEINSPRPNIIIILADDLGYADVGFNGAKDIITPNLDALAEGGVSFSQAYVAHPFCGPSRAALMTGRYPHKMGAQFNLPTRGSFVGVPTTEEFISKALQKTGYFTGAIGKWHLGEASEYHPNKRGFDEFFGFLGGGHNYFPTEFEKTYNKQIKQGIRNIDHYVLPLEYNGKPVRETQYITDALSREAVKFVKKAADKNNPFFLYLAYNAPHVPLQAKEEDMRQFPDIEDTKRKTYAGMVYAVDRGVGDIINTLKAVKKLDNTLIIFLSDNGGKLSEGGDNSPLKEGKGSVHEGGFRTPMLMHWPEYLEKPQRFEHPVLALDLYPTLVGLAGAELSKDKKLDGKDIWSDLINGVNPHKDELIYTLRHRKGLSDAAVRRNEWKAVKTGTKPWQLYNINEDIGETIDLSRKHKVRLKDMILEMEKWTWNNAQPLWFHKSEEGADWRKDGMPRFDETFRIK